MTRKTGTLQEDICKFLIVYRWITLGIRNISGEGVEKLEKRILCSITFPQNRVVYGLCRNIW